MKKLILLIVLAFVAFAYHKVSEQKREKLIGTWAMERSFQGGWLRLIMNLKPDGQATVDVDASVQGRVRSKGCLGTWAVRNSSLLVTFTSSEIPVYTIGKNYGGHDLTVEEKSFSYQSDDHGVETWNRLH